MSQEPESNPRVTSVTKQGVPCVIPKLTWQCVYEYIKVCSNLNEIKEWMNTNTSRMVSIHGLASTSWS